MSIESSSRYLASEFDSALSHAHKFVITKVISSLGVIGCVAAIIVMAAGVGMATTNVTAVMAAMSVSAILLLVTLITSFICSIASIVYNILAAIKFGNIFNTLNLESFSSEKSKGGASRLGEIMNVSKNIKNYLWAHLVIAILCMISFFIFPLVCLILSIVNFVLLIVI